MQTKISILGYKDFIDLTKGIIKGLNLNATIDVYQCFLEECYDLLPMIEENGTDIIITGRANQVFLQDKTHIPIMTFRITPFDILSAIKKSLQITKHIAIALADFEELDYDYSILQDLLNIELHLISYTTEQELRRKIREFAKTDGAVIGTSIAVNFAKEIGLHGTLIYSLENSVIDSIKHANELIEFKRNEEKHAKEFKAIIDSVKDGIIATNEQDEITLINYATWGLLDLPAGKGKGKHLSQILPQEMSEIILDINDFRDKMIKTKNSILNANRTEVFVKQNKVGSVITFQDITEIQKIEEKYRLEIQAKGLVAKAHFEDIIHVNDLMRETIDNAKKFAQTESTILITGETGTGKELFAQSIHNYSKRKSYPFVAINCAALPETLLESELFGYEDGAFTGASKKGKKGLFEIAHHGTVFLDEINSVTLHFQVRLLRVLQEKEIVRIGSNKVIPVNVRIIAASNANLYELVEIKKFRADLFYRLNVLRLPLPPLRDRMEDFGPLTKEFIQTHDKQLYDHLLPFMDTLCKELSKHPFYGNIRELHNILERFIVLCDDKMSTIEYYQRLLKGCIDGQHKPVEEKKEEVSFTIKTNYKESLVEAERSLIRKYLEKYNGDKITLAAKLGMGKTTFYRKLKELNIKA